MARRTPGIYGLSIPVGWGLSGVDDLGSSFDSAREIASNVFPLYSSTTLRVASLHRAAQLARSVPPTAFAPETISVDRECLGGRHSGRTIQPLPPRAFAITTFELSRPKVWQGNCFMGIDTDLSRVVRICATQRGRNCPAEHDHTDSLPPCGLVVCWACSAAWR